MLREYAIDPEALSTWSDVRYFLGELVPWKGRLMVALPKDWKRRVYESASRCTDLERKRIEEQLNLVDKRAIVRRKGTTYDQTKPWLENALAEHRREQLDGIVVCSGVSTPPLLLANDASDGHPLWKSGSSQMVTRSPQVVSSLLRTLVRRSNRVLVVDPYFRFATPNKRIMLEAIMAKDHIGTVTFEVHVNDDLSEAVHKQQAAALNRPLKVVQWPHNDAVFRMHNRYVISERSGIQFGDSIEKGAGRDHVAILGPDAHDELWTHLTKQS